MKIKNRIKGRIKEGLLYPFIIVFVILFIYFFSFGFTLDQLRIVTPYFILVVLAQYVFNFQYEITEIDLFSDNFKIRFPLSIYLKERSFPLKAVTKIEIEDRPGTHAAPRLFIFTKDGKRVKINYSGHDEDTKYLIEYFRSHGILVEIIRRTIF